MKSITGIPNQGAGVGHAFVDWGKAYYIAKLHQLKFLHSPFSGNNLRWEGVLGLGRFLPHYREEDFDLHVTPDDLSIEQFLLHDFAGARAVYVLDGNHGHGSILGPSSYESMGRYLRYSYLSSRRHRPFFNPFRPGKVHIALHIRRGNITQHQEFQSRILPHEHYSKALLTIYESATPDAFDVIVITNDQSDETKEFAAAHGARLMDLGSDVQDFHTLVSSDILIASNPGFSYLASIINLDSIKIVPSDFWHLWPTGSFLASELDTQAPKLFRQITNLISTTRPLGRTTQRNIWNRKPFAVLQPKKFRDLVIDNSSRQSELFSSPSKKSGFSDDSDQLFIAHSRRYLGAFVNGMSNQLQLESSEKDSYRVFKRPAAFIDLSSLYLDATLPSNLTYFLKQKFNETLISRTFIIPHFGQLTLSNLASAYFHTSISFLCIPPVLVYCNDIIVIKIFSTEGGL
jgi:hypothetical protein